MEDSRERMVRYLQDAHAAEVGIKDALEGFINDSDDTQLRSLFQEHATLTESQADRLEKRLRAYDESPSGGKGFFNTLMAKFSEMMQGAHDEWDQNVLNLVKSYATEHLERGMYESMASFAEAIGDNETATLARQIQSEEMSAADRLWPFISRYASMTASTSKMATPGDRAYPA